MSKFVIRPAQSNKKQWAALPLGQRPHYIVEIADNGEPVSVSEFYADRGNALRAAQRRAMQYIEKPAIEIDTEESE